jgi:FSR family fosmidomycin resistance protein-like MFS transporter
LGLGVVGVYKGFLTPLLPLLIVHRGLTLTAAGTLSAILMMPAAFGQVAWGEVGDRMGRRTLLIIGPAATGILASLIGTVPVGLRLGLLLAVTGLAASIYAPQAAAIVGRSDDGDQGMSGLGLLYMVGIVGGGSASLVVVPLVTFLSLDRLYLSAAIGIVFSILLALRLPPLAGKTETFSKATTGETLVRRWRLPLSALLLIAILGAAMGMGFSTFIPVLVSQKGLSLFSAGGTFTLYMYAGALGSVLGPKLVPRWGARKVMLVSLLLPTPLFLGFGRIDGPLALLFLSLGAVAMYSSLSINVSLGQQLLPQRAGTISALMMGFSWGLGSLAAIGVGALADWQGTPVARALIVAVPLITVPLVAAVPVTRQGRIDW